MREHRVSSGHAPDEEHGRHLHEKRHNDRKPEPRRLGEFAAMPWPLEVVFEPAIAVPVVATASVVEELTGAGHESIVTAGGARSISSSRFRPYSPGSTARMRVRTPNGSFWLPDLDSNQEPAG